MLKQTRSVQAEGAELVLDAQGKGPPLLLIPGGGGDASVYAELSRILADDFTVVTYDRRGSARSSGDTSVNLDMAQQARDSLAVLRAAGYERAYVFGNSGGGNIALQLGAANPEAVAALLVHEPPVIRLLPDAGEWIEFNKKVYQTFLDSGVKPAIMMFAGALVGFDGPVAGGLGQGKDLSFFLGKEFLQIANFIPDLEAIKAAQIPTALMVGELSGQAYYARTAPIVAERLGCACMTIPGNHLAFKIEPTAFAAALRKVISQIIH